jgi:hypothetical protein
MNLVKTWGEGAAVKAAVNRGLYSNHQRQQSE